MNNSLSFTNKAWGDYLDWLDIEIKRVDAELYSVKKSLDKQEDKFTRALKKLDSNFKRVIGTIIALGAICSVCGFPYSRRYNKLPFFRTETEVVALW